MKGWRAGAVSVLAMLGVCLAFAAGAAELQEGRDFRLVSPPLTALFPGDRYLTLTRGDYEELLATIDPLVVRVRLETGMR